MQRFCYSLVLAMIIAMSAVLGMSLPGYSAMNLPRTNLSRFTPAQMAGAYQYANILPLGQRVAFWADLAANDTVYQLDPLGEGAKQQPDDGPLYDFTHVDCVTYVEQVYAFTLTSNYDAFQDMLQRIRYRDGQVDYRWRNHYLVSDWLPANSWFTHDVTDELGGKAVKSMTKTISRGKFFSGKGLPQYANIPDESSTTTYIPRERVAALLPTLRSGDMVIFVLDTPGIIAGHTGLLRVQRDTVMLQHASLTHKTVETVSLAGYVQTMPARFIGLKIIRPFTPA